MDEEDEILQKLKVWTVDENGISTLLSLKEAGVGAIYLGAKDTPFSLTNAKNEVNAIIRQTGMFLFESGRPGAIQQVDMAISNISWQPSGLIVNYTSWQFVSLRWCGSEVEHFLGKEGVTGSIPVISFI